MTINNNSQMTWAEGEVGFVEGPNNDNPYGPWQGVWQAAYCDSFAQQAAVQQGGFEWPLYCQFGVKGDAYTPYTEAHARKLGIWHDKGDGYEPCRGDQRLYDWTGWGGCFLAGTLVSTPTGQREIQSIEDGDSVWDRDGCLARVTASRLLTRETVALDALGVPTTITTADHPYWARRRLPAIGRNVRRYGDPEWIPAGDLAHGDFIGLPVPASPQSIIMDPDIAYLLGCWVADGSAEPNRERVDIDDDPSQAERLRKAIAAAGCERVGERFVKGAIRFRIADPWFYRMTVAFGRGSANKQVAPEAFLWQREARVAFLTGYSSGDGWLNPQTERTAATTISRSLAVSVAALVRGLGMPACLLELHGSSTRVIEGVERNCAETFYKVTWVDNYADRRRHEVELDDDFMWTPVRDVKSTGVTETVYDLATSSHTFVADGAAVHNCDHIETYWGMENGKPWNIGANTGSPGGVRYVQRDETYLRGTVAWSDLGGQDIPSVPSGPRELRKGFSGEDVLWLQHRLMELGYDVPGGADGDFGPGTEQAVFNFQHDWSPPVDGIVGLVTREALAEDSHRADMHNPPPEPAPSYPQWAGVYLKRGDIGDEVRAFQARLKERGWTIVADGWFGRKTQQVVIGFQRNKNLVPDGIVGPTTWSAFWTEPIT